MKKEVMEGLENEGIKGGRTWNPLEKARYFWLLLRRLRGTPETLARGVALGTFVAITPTIPLHTIQIVILSPLLKANPIAAMVTSIIVSNPLTIPLQYYGAWKAGTILTGFSIPWEEVKALLASVEHTDIITACSLILHKSLKLIEAMLLGGVVISLPIAIVSYFVALKFYTSRAARREAATAELAEGVMEEDTSSSTVRDES